MPDPSRTSGSPRAESRGDWRSAIRKRLAALHLAPEREVEIVDEVAQHLEDRYRDMRASGLDERAAGAAAWRELEDEGVLTQGLTRTERSRLAELPPPGAPSPVRRLSALWQDVRYSLRTLRQQPTFTITVLLALALSIGPTTAIVSVANWLLWKPVPGVTDGHRLALAQFATKAETGLRMNGVNIAGVSIPNLMDLNAGARSLAGATGVAEGIEGVVAGDAAPQVTGVSQVTGNFFDVLGLRMAAGRPLMMGDDRDPATASAAVVSQNFAVSTFGSFTAALGQRVAINRRPFTVVGVVGGGFHGIGTTSRVDVWITTAGHVDDEKWEARRARSRGLFNELLVRIAPGYTAAQAASELSLLARNLAGAHPQDNAKFASATATVTPGLNTPPVQRAGTQSRVNFLLIIGGVLLLLGCANAANILIARAIRREHEVAIRKALGATRARLMQLQLTESCVLAAGGAAMGMILAVALKRVMQHRLFPPIPGYSMEPVPIDMQVLAVTTATAIVVGLVAGVAPAWLVARGKITGAVSRAGGSRTASRAPRLRSGLAVAQLALSLTLLIGALLFVGTLRNLRNVEVGFDPKNLTVLAADLRSNAYTPAASIAYQRDLLNALNVSAVGNATLSFRSPFGSSRITRVLSPAGQPIRTVSNGVAPNYFAVLGTPILKGRGFTEDEAFTTGSSNGSSIVINETLARQLFGDADPIGGIVRTPATQTAASEQLHVIGLARDARWNGLTAPPEPFIYFPLGRFDLSSAVILIRSPRPIATVIAEARAVAARIDGVMPLSSQGPMTAAIERGMRSQQLFSTMLTWLSTLAVILAAIGLHGLVAQTTVERTREFGIRLAIGAKRTDIARLVGRYIVTICALGTAAGIALAMFGVRLIRTMLFGVDAIDPTIYAAAAGMLIAVVALATAWPAFRATRVQPVDVLRAE